MKKVKIIINIIAIILFVMNYQICELFYSDDIKAWWSLKVNLYAVIIALVFISHSLETKGWLKFVLYVGVGFTISNVIDKVFFDIRVFTSMDLVMIITTFIFAGINLMNEKLSNE